MLLMFCGILLRHVTGGMFPVRIDGTVTHYDCIFTNSALILVHTSGRAARTAATAYCDFSCKNLAAGQQHKIHHAAGGIWGRGPKFRAAHDHASPAQRAPRREAWRAKRDGRLLAVCTEAFKRNAKFW